MSAPASPVNSAIRRQAGLRYALRTAYCSVACLVGAPVAAHAHDDDETPSPLAILMGITSFLVVLGLLLAMCRYALRPRGYRPPRHRSRKPGKRPPRIAKRPRPFALTKSGRLPKNRHE